jgi:hypothetical protein
MLLLTDYRCGALGRVSLETPQTRRSMLDQAPSPRAEPGPDSGE